MVRGRHRCTAVPEPNDVMVEPLKRNNKCPFHQQENILIRWSILALSLLAGDETRKYLAGGRKGSRGTLTETKPLGSEGFPGVIVSLETIVV